MQMRRHLAVVLAGSMLLVACRPPATARPREGAPVVVASQTTRIDLGTMVPPTLAPAAPLVVTPTSTDAQRGTPSATTAPTHVIAATGGTAVNLRQGPSVTAPVITTLREGTPVETLGDPVSAEGRQWQKVRVGDREGWVVAVVVHRR
jgi:hypothetical protein